MQKKFCSAMKNRKKVSEWQGQLFFLKLHILHWGKKGKKLDFTVVQLEKAGFAADDRIETGNVSVTSDIFNLQFTVIIIDLLNLSLMTK